MKGLWGRVNNNILNNDNNNIFKKDNNMVLNNKIKATQDVFVQTITPEVRLVYGR